MASITIDMESLACTSCFCPYFVPDYMYALRVKHALGIFCPGCAFENFYAPDAPAGIPLEERQKQIQALHDAEQSEAREADQAAAPKRRRSRKA